MSTTRPYTVRPLTGWVGARTPAVKRRSRYSFKADYDNTCRLLKAELEHLDASGVVLQLDVDESDIRLDGGLRAGASSRVGEQGVRLLFDSRHGPLTYQTDSCEMWQHNVRSIALGLEALRAVDRYGVSQHGEQYRGWHELTAGESLGPLAPLLDLVNVWSRADVRATEDLPRDELVRLWRRARANAHPDRSNDPDSFHAVVAAGRALGLTD